MTTAADEPLDNATQTPVRVVLVDDDSLVRAGLKLMLRSPGIEVVAECGDGTDVARQVLLTQADVVLMDIRMPNKDGIAATRDVMNARPSTAVVVLTTFDADELVVDALRAGAVGFLLKDTTPNRIIDAVHAAAAGEPSLAPQVATRLMARAVAGTNPAAAEARRRLEALTPREREVAEAVADGLVNAEIAEQLYLSVPTVKAHVSSIMAKINAENRVQLAVLVHDARSAG